MFLGSEGDGGISIDAHTIDDDFWCSKCSPRSTKTKRSLYLGVIIVDEKVVESALETILGSHEGLIGGTRGYRSVGRLSDRSLRIDRSIVEKITDIGIAV